MDHQEMFETLALSEGVQIKYKDESALMRAIGLVAKLFNPRFMVSMTTTFGTTIYFPNRKWVSSDYAHAWRVLCHELVHVEDYRKQGQLFNVLYSLPQGLALLSLLGLVFQSWWFLLFLLFLAPIPAPWRMKAEMRGYAMTMAVEYWLLNGGIRQSLKDNIARNFTGSGYYFMWPFADAVRKEIGRWSKKILCEEIFSEGEIYGRIHSMIKERLPKKRPYPA